MLPGQHPGSGWAGHVLDNNYANSFAGSDWLYSVPGSWHKPPSLSEPLGLWTATQNELGPEAGQSLEPEPERQMPAAELPQSQQQLQVECEAP